MSFKILQFLIFLYLVHFSCSLVTCEGDQTNQTCVLQPSTNGSSPLSAETELEQKQGTDTLISNPIEENGDNSTVGVDISVFGMRDFIEEAKALFPTMSELKAMFDAIANTLFEKNKQKAQELIEEVRSIPEVQRVANFLHDYIDFDKVLEFIYYILGWTEENV